jgi:hypothetical protein
MDPWRTCQLDLPEADDTAAEADTVSAPEAVTSLADAAATLQVVVPGFLAMRVFYWLAFPILFRPIWF